MSFTTLIKNEICANEYSGLENTALLSGFIRNNITVDNNIINIISENPKVIRKVFSIFKELFDINPVLNQIKGSTKKSYYNIIIDEKVEVILKTLMYNEEIPTDYFLDSDDLKRAYLRGAFLAKGSINDPKTARYHLEFLVDKEKEALFIKDLLSYFDLNAKVIDRDKGYMTYIKEAEKIGDFLRLVSAYNQVLYYEDIRIYRDHKNMTNRLNNMEQANVDKTISASEKVLEDIDLIKEMIGLDAIDDKIKTAIEYREKYPESSLSELAKIITLEEGKPITKSGLSHRLRKIKEIADKLKKDD